MAQSWEPWKNILGLMLVRTFDNGLCRQKSHLLKKLSFIEVYNLNCNNQVTLFFY